MQLVPELAKKIVNEVKLVIKENVIVVNPDGEIIASTDVSRVGSYHEGAKIVMNKRRKLYVSQEMSKTLEGVKPGINLPIFFENEIIGVIGITGIPTDIEPFAELIRRMTELIIREANFIERKGWETRGLESFFYEWIYNQQMDEEFIHRGEILGISVRNPYICILFQLSSPLPPEKLPYIQASMNLWFEKQYPKKKDDYLVQWGRERYVLLVSNKRTVLIEKLEYELKRWQKYFLKNHQISFAMGVGNPSLNQQIFSSYEEAKKALKVAEKNESVVFYHSLILDIILQDVSDQAKQLFLERVLSCIQQDFDLMETLKRYFKNNQSLKKTAEDLHIHINTLHYRLKQMKDLTGIDPKSTEGIALFYIALSYFQSEEPTKTKSQIR